MNRLALLPVLLRDRFGPRTLPREPEPDLVMDDPQQVAAYDEAGSIDGLMASAYLFHSARISQVVQGCNEVVDLGCGPAIQLAQIAQLNPGTRFHGIDLSPTMLEKARANVERLGLANVRFTRGDVTDLSLLADRSVDGVISTMALHHLPTLDHLRACFREIDRVLRDRGALYLVDFGRLKQLKTVIFFAYQNAGRQPHLFTLDYERSLRAAFEVDDFRAAAAAELPGRAEVVSTFMVPMLTVVKTADRPLPGPLRQRLRAARSALPKRYRSDLDDMRAFFRLGGLANDPF
jgi:SAM-dependent methyltransferase